MIHPSLLAVPSMFLTVIGFFSFFFFLESMIDLSTNFPSAPQSIRAVASAIFRPSEVYVPIESLFGDLDCTNTLLIAKLCSLEGVDTDHSLFTENPGGIIRALFHHQVLLSLL